MDHLVDVATATAAEDAGVRLAHQRLDRRGVAESTVGRGIAGLLKRIDAFVDEARAVKVENLQLKTRVGELERARDKWATENVRSEARRAPAAPIDLGDIKLTDRQRETYDTIVAFWRQFGYAPSFRDIMRRSSHVSTSVVNYTLRKLRKLGLIDFEDKINRSITVTGATWSPPDTTPE